MRLPHRSGLLADVASDGERFTARLTRWEAWEAKDLNAAKRAAEYRSRPSGDVCNERHTEA